MAAQAERQPLVAEQAVQVDVLAGVVAGVDGRAPGLGFAAAVVFADVADVAAVAEAGSQCEGPAEAIVGADAQPRGLEPETAGAAPPVVLAEAPTTARPARELLCCPSSPCPRSLHPRPLPRPPPGAPFRAPPIGPTAVMAT